MAEGITDHVWSWKELLMFKVGISTMNWDITCDIPGLPASCRALTGLLYGMSDPLSGLHILT